MRSRTIGGIRGLPSNVYRLQTGLLSRWRWFVDYSGPGNRIWIAWNDDFIDVDILDIWYSIRSLSGSIHDIHEPILITVVYGANDISTRRELWQGLTDLAVSVDLPWLVGEDFDAVLDISEVSGASGDIRVAMNEFNDCILQTGLISIPMQGERFSWHNCSTDGRSLWKRLDRMFVNDAWMERWPNLFYTSLTLRTSDHSPFVLKGQSRCAAPSDWYSDVFVTRKLKALQPVFLQQRRKKGDLAMNVKLASGFLEVAQKLLQVDRHNSLYCNLRTAAVLFRRVATRRANKRIFQISDSDGLVQTDPTTISSVFVAYFQGLLGGDRTDRVLDLYYLRPWARHILTEEEACALIRPVTSDDVKTTLFDIEEDKAPGPDGRLLKQVNATLLTLIPKYELLIQLLILGLYLDCRLPPRCALKVDLRKAYDTVEWDFLFATLRMFGFPAVFIRGTGLRQGDPMSPYLFVLVMEVLQMILQQFIEQDASGLRDSLLETLGFQEGHQPVRYLGLPLISHDFLLQIVNRCYRKLTAALRDGKESNSPLQDEFSLSNLFWFPWSGYPREAWEVVCRPIEEGGQVKENKGAWVGGKCSHLDIHCCPISSSVLGMLTNTGLLDKLYVVMEDGQWNWPMITDIACLEITHMLPPISEGPDRISWKSNDGSFNTSTAYDLFHPPGPKVVWSSLLLVPSRSRRTTLSFGLLSWGDCPHWINRGFITLAVTAFCARMESPRHMTTFSLHALYPADVLPLSDSRYHFLGPTVIGNEEFNRHQPDGEESMWLMQHFDLYWPH
ncbi:UNVERIFIED_CONTAM: hypothetical protein Sradi_7099200 [Sesamum radiatum]|uniref:Reverse transcriptase domain-containing protein n=1 Tax=Sesamum radiatum TaxID=300843 RepID=A0AAW2J2V7_SESRA